MHIEANMCICIFPFLFNKLSIQCSMFTTLIFHLMYLGDQPIRYFLFLWMWNFLLYGILQTLSFISCCFSALWFMFYFYFNDCLFPFLFRFILWWGFAKTNQIRTPVLSCPDELAMEAKSPLPIFLVTSWTVDMWVYVEIMPFFSGVRRDLSVGHPQEEFCS